jgi:glycosyltransferase involved in cell wall biosynthesis
MAEPHLTIDARMAHDGGIGTYIRGVVPRIAALRQDWRISLIVKSRAIAGTPAWIDAPNVRFLPCDVPIYSVREQPALFAATPRDATVFWAPHYNLPLAVRAPIVVTVHDVIHLARNEYRRRPLRRALARGMFAAVRRRARAILFDSAFTHEEFVRCVGQPVGASRVVHLGIGDEWRTAGCVPRQTQRPRPYIVYVGYRKPHKNLLGLLEAFRSLINDLPHDLVIVGRAEGLRTIAQRVNDTAAALTGRVVLTGEIDDETLRALVANAALLVQPSFYEGFGFPPLEAMAAGCPCVVSNAASLPEVCGDAAAYCNPDEPATIAAAIRDVLSSSAFRQELIDRGRSRAAMFTWQRCAEGTLPAIEGVL